ncbi:MAG: HpaII family restriction endonuclease [Bacteroidales bacterium]|nr:HpaII family restriction endonuclease [Bacteroidales bacterium]
MKSSIITLLNASSATIFTYELVGSDDKEILLNIRDKRTLFIEIVNDYIKRSNLKFSKIKNNIFNNNLILIDSQLPEILAWLLLDCFKRGEIKISKSVDNITKANPLGYDISENHDYYGYKIRAMLNSIAYGMIPTEPWNGKYDMSSSIMSKEPIKNIDNDYSLEDYLFHNTKFETPENKRYNSGVIYKVDDKYYFDLVLQIRFT